MIFGQNSNEKNWKNAKCSCPAYFKNYICKHIIGLAARLKFIVIPNEAKTVPIGEKRKRGRPARAKKALETQPIFASASETPIQSTPITMQTQVQPAKRPRGRPPKPKPTL